MPADESDDEVAARDLVQARLGVTLTFNDNDPHEGRVDYIFALPDGRTAAMEVTRLTDEDLRQAAAAFDKYVGAPVEVNGLQCCWSVSLDEAAGHYKGFAGSGGTTCACVGGGGG